MQFIPFNDSNGELRLLEPIRIEQQHALMLSMGMQRKLSPEQRKEYQEKFLADIYPDMTPYDREAAFVTAWQKSTTSPKLVTNCPYCQAQCGFSATLSVQNPYQLKIDVPHENPKYRIVFKNPSAAGAQDFGPKSLEFLVPVHLPADRFPPELGEKIICAGEETVYTGFEIPETVLRIPAPVPWNKIPAPVLRQLQGILISEHQSQIKSRMKSAVSGTTKTFCSACRQKATYNLTSFEDILEAIVIEQQYLADGNTIATLAEMGLLTASEAKQMSQFELDTFIKMAEKRLESRREKNK